MRFGGYILMMFAMAAVLYLTGLNSQPFNHLNNQSGGMIDTNTTLNKMSDNILNPGLPLTSIGIALGAMALGGAAILAGFSAVYIIPIIILIVVSSFVVFPITDMLDPSSAIGGTMPAPIRTVLMLAFGFILILGILSFIRGGDA